MRPFSNAECTSQNEALFVQPADVVGLLPREDRPILQAGW